MGAGGGGGGDGGVVALGGEFVEEGEGGGAGRGGDVVGDLVGHFGLVGEGLSRGWICLRRWRLEWRR